MRKYLKVTIFDNDFMDELEDVAYILYRAFYSYDKYPTEKDFPYLKKCIRNIMNSSYCIHCFARGDENLPDTETNDKYFTPKLFIVEEIGIPEWENYECIYIPLFDNGEIIKR